MSGKDTENKDAPAKKPVQILRERRGGAPRELLERNRRLNKIRKQIIQALQQGPKTVPELSQQTEIPSAEVFWHLMCMRKYGKLAEIDEREGYSVYGLKEEEKENK